AVEAELVWDNAEHGTIAHRACLQLAERSGVTLSLRDWMLSTVWQQVGEWHAEGYPVRAVLSLSANQVTDPDLLKAVAEVVHTVDGPDPSWLCLGVPVSAVLGSNREETRENLGNVRAHGVGLAVHGLRGAAEELD